MSASGWVRASVGLETLSSITSGLESFRSTRIRQVQRGRMRFSTRTMSEGAHFVGFAVSDVGFATSEEWRGDNVGVTLSMGGGGGTLAAGHGLDEATLAVGGGPSAVSLYAPAGQVCLGVHTTRGAFESACEMLELPAPDLARQGLRMERRAPEQLAAFRGYFESLRVATVPPFESSSELGESVARELARLLAGHRTRACGLPVAAARVRAVRRINEHVGADPTRAYSLAELCRIACVSARTLEYAFHEYCGLSPHAYVRALRMQEVWRLLCRDELGVTDAAMRCGFTHLGQFSADFRQMFGVLPSAVGGVGAATASPEAFEPA